jgi:Fe-S-cluster containining protein
MENSECQCDTCKEECSFNPGWFLPGEAEKAAKHLNMSLQDFFKQYLGINWWEADHKTDNDIFVLAPAIVDMEAGQEYPSDPRGQCVFLEKGLCKIHAVKPFECAQFIHGDKTVSERHWKVAQAWQKHQSQIKELLGREAESSEYEGGGLMGLLAGW